ncbi:MAG: SRPBCC domain-containing protein [Putridiphycobacter sp.]|nr:SRPBCC domain-containing protein [Putridiphycobacter sp.]
MTKTIKTSISIQASASEVWAVLTDFEKYPMWNPFITSISGSVVEGKKITARIIPEGSKGMTFKPVILVKKEKEELKWIGNLFFKGLFDGEHQFLISDNGNGSVLFQQNEKFTGLLVNLFPESLYINSRRGFEAMNIALKALAEER